MPEPAPTDTALVDPVEPLVLTVDQAADLLQVSRWTVYREVKAGRIPVIRVGHQLRFPRHRLIEMLRGEEEAPS